MKVSHEWLQSYFDTQLPAPEEVARLLTFHSFEIEGVEKKGRDSIIDVDVLANRAHDCLSHRGIAKELSAILNIPLKDDPFRHEEKGLPVSKALSVSIENPTLCRRYIGALLRGVKVGPSPDWLKGRLEATGQKSINNVVDATNYVMFNLGQPLHAFDADKLKVESGKWKVAVRNAKEGEKITTLGGGEYALTAENLLIVDGGDNAPIGIAGVKGGTAAEINETTKDIIIESANFHPTSIRKTSQALKLRTDASTRFENDLAPEIAYHAMRDVVTLILDIAGGEVEGYADVYPRPKTSAYKTGVSLEEINGLLGTAITEKETEDILSRLGFSYEKVSPTEKVIEVARNLEGVPYKYGASILYDAPHAFDCSSFVAYCFAQAGVSIPRVSVDQYVYGEPVEEKDMQPCDVIFAVGESSKEGTFVRIADGKEVTEHVAKYKSVEYMPGTEVPEGVSHCGLYLGDGMVAHAEGNGGAGKVVIESLKESKSFKNIVGVRRMTGDALRYAVTVPFERLDIRSKEDLIEEIGRIYGYENIPEATVATGKERPTVNKCFYYAEKVRQHLTEKGFTEVYTYSLRDRGIVELENPFASDKRFMRQTLAEGVRGSLLLNEKNAPLLGLEAVRIFEIGKVFSSEGEHTSVCLGVAFGGKKGEKEAGLMLREAIGGLSNVFDTIVSGEEEEGTFECNLDRQIEGLPEPKSYDSTPAPRSTSYKQFSVYPFVLRDLSLWVPKAVSSGEILRTIKEVAGDLLVHTRLFDEYKKGDKVSYAFRLVFQSPEKTLSDDEVNVIMNTTTASLQGREGFEIR